jgi:transposase InsO family protein
VGCSQNSLTTQNRPSWRDLPQVKEGTSHSSLAADPTRIALANEYLEIFHNPRRRHSALGMRTPVEYEMMTFEPIPVA